MNRKMFVVLLVAIFLAATAVPALAWHGQTSTHVDCNGWTVSVDTNWEGRVGTIIHSSNLSGSWGERTSVSWSVTVQWETGETWSDNGTLHKPDDCEPEYEVCSETEVVGEWSEWQLDEESGREFRTRTVTHVDVRDNEHVCHEETRTEWRDAPPFCELHPEDPACNPEPPKIPPTDTPKAPPCTWCQFQCPLPNTPGLDSSQSYNVYGNQIVDFKQGWNSELNQPGVYIEIWGLEYSMNWDGTTHPIMNADGETVVLFTAVDSHNENPWLRCQWVLNNPGEGAGQGGGNNPCPDCVGYVCEKRRATWSYFDAFRGENRWASIDTNGNFANDLSEPAAGFEQLGFQCSNCLENLELGDGIVLYGVNIYPANLWQQIADFRGHQNILESDQAIADAIAAQWREDGRPKSQTYDIRDFLPEETT